MYYLSFFIPNDLAKSFCTSIARWEAATATEGGDDKEEAAMKAEAEAHAQKATDALLLEMEAGEEGTGDGQQKASGNNKGGKGKK